MAKKRITISVDEEIIQLVENKIRDGTFRNISHGFELSAKKQLAEQKSG